jgi:hypothetical protein
MSARRAAVCRPTHAEPLPATRQPRDDSPYAQTPAGFSLGEDPDTRRRLLMEVPLR